MSVKTAVISPSSSSADQGSTPGSPPSSQPGSGGSSVVADPNSLYAGIARSGIRALALYFSRPVRLFRPSRASGWTSLRSAAQRDGATLSPQYVTQYVKQHGFGVLPRHFLPPLFINTVLGTLLFTSYTTVSSELTIHFPNASSTQIAAISGASAGAIQAIAGAPAENVRLLMEQGTFHSQTSVSGWRHAWKEVFALDPANNAASTTTASSPTMTKATQSQLTERTVRMRLSDAREAKIFAQELREMAGRGWNGWGWGFAKDILGYGIFFAIFDISRRTAIHTSHIVESIVTGRQGWTIGTVISQIDNFEHHNSSRFDGTRGESRAPTTARVAQGLTLVSGGVIAGIAYEYAGRPFDAVRREWHVQRLSAFPPSSLSPSSSPSTCPPRPSAIPPLPTLIHNVYASGGIRAFFSSPSYSSPSDSSTTATSSSIARRLYPILRTLGRVGPWGAGFLVWEAFGPGIQ